MPWLPYLTHSAFGNGHVTNHADMDCNGRNLGHCETPPNLIGPRLPSVINYRAAKRTGGLFFREELSSMGSTPTQILNIGDGARHVNYKAMSGSTQLEQFLPPPLS